jgi:hypothetical protein
MFAYGVAVAIAYFIAFEVFDVVDRLGGVLATGGTWAAVSVVGMEMIIDVAVKTLGAVKPGAYADEDASGEPLGAVVAVGSAVVGRDVVVAVGTDGCGPDFDSDLGLGLGSANGETECSYSCQQQQHEFVHFVMVLR